MARWGQADRRVTARTVRLTMNTMKRLAGDESVAIESERTRAKPVQHEARDQVELAKWVARQWWGVFFYHWPNEYTPPPEREMGKAAARTFQQREGKRRRDKGVRSGPADNWLFVPSGRYAFAVSELKREGARPSETRIDQRWFLEAVSMCDARQGVHRGLEEAKAFFLAHVAGMTADQERRAREHANRLKEARGDVLPEVGR